MPHPSIRGVGIRYLIALMLPVSGIILVLYTVAQICGHSLHDARALRARTAPLYQGSAVSVAQPLPQPSPSGASPRK